MKRIGVMGGTFNPIHNGHLAVARAAKEQFSLEKVLFMPSGVPYMKNQREVLPIETRCEMTALAIRNIPGFALSKIEAEDSVQGKNTYTCDTLMKLRHADPDAAYYFIVGADSLYAMESWKNPALIFENCTVLAAVRTEIASFASQAAFETGALGQDGDSGNLRERLNSQVRHLREKYHAAIELLAFAGMDISSTQLRERAREGESLRGMVPEAVDAYIRKHHLYEKDS